MKITLDLTEHQLDMLVNVLESAVVTCEPRFSTRRKTKLTDEAAIAYFGVLTKVEAARKQAG